jgi:flavorubredoxin
MVNALILYHNQQYGNTEKMAKAVEEGLIEAGCKVTLHNSNTQRYPIKEYGKYDLVSIGTPDYFSDIAGTLKTFLDDWWLNRNQPGFKDKLYALFLSHGGGGRAKDSLSIFRHLGTQKGQTIISEGSPNKTVLKQCKDLGLVLVKKIGKPFLRARN